MLMVVCDGGADWRASETHVERQTHGEEDKLNKKKYFHLEMLRRRIICYANTDNTYHIRSAKIARKLYYDVL